MPRPTPGVLFEEAREALDTSRGLGEPVVMNEEAKFEQGASRGGKGDPFLDQTGQSPNCHV